MKKLTKNNLDRLHPKTIRVFALLNCASKALVLGILSATILPLSKVECAYAASGSSQEPSTSFGLRGSYLTWKSSLAESNDFGLGYYFNGRVLAGEDKQILVEMVGSTEKASFALNSSSLQQKNLEFLAGWNGEFVQLAGGLGTSQNSAKLTGSKTLETTSRVFSGLLATDFSLVKGAKAFLETRVMYPFETIEATKQDVTLGMKLMINVGTSFDITKKSLDLLTGVIYSKQTLSLAGKGSGDVTLCPYLGFVWSMGL